MALAGAARAQTASTPTAAPSRSGSTVSGVTVRPQPYRSCGSRDQACVALVVADLKLNYPEQLKAFCFQWQTQSVRTQFVYNQLALEHGSGAHPPLPTAFGVNSAVKSVRHGQDTAVTPSDALGRTDAR
jgi:hypothetical protein